MNYEAEHCLLRTVRCVSGAVELSVLCEPVFGYGRRRARWEFSSPGYGEAVTVSDDEGDPVLRLATDRRLGIEDPIAVIRSRMVEGEQAFVALSWGSLPPPRTWEEATRKQRQTTEFWRQWITGGEFPDHQWRGQLQRSALTLKGLTYAPTGALVAAPTTSLPETPGGVRNWDDRYTWVRDSTFALWALYTLGLDREADDFFAFIRDVAAEDDLQVRYGIDGEKDLPEVTVEGPGGYDGARPVRIGNAAAHQRQIDIWGTMLDSVYLHAKSRGQLPEPLWPVLMCWVALDRGARLARLHGEADYARKWDTVAEEIHEDICRSGVDDRGVFVQSYGTTEFLSESPPVRKLVAMVPTPRCDHRENELPALVQQSLVNARVVLADRLGNVSEIELDGSTAARLPQSSD